MDKMYTIKDAVEITGLDTRQIMYRVRRKHIDAQKIGWIWLVTEEGMEQLKKIANSKRKRLPNGVADVTE